MDRDGQPRSQHPRTSTGLRRPDSLTAIESNSNAIREPRLIPIHGGD